MNIWWLKYVVCFKINKEKKRIRIWKKEKKGNKIINRITYALLKID